MKHIQAVRTNKQNSKFAQHILETQHTYGMIEETMDIVLHIENKGLLLNTWILFHINSLSTQKLQMNDMYTNISNSIFDLIMKHI
jgi:hypothetical protein